MKGKQTLISVRELFGAGIFRVSYQLPDAPRRVHHFWAKDKEKATSIAIQFGFPPWPIEVPEWNLQNLAWNTPNAVRDLNKYLRSKKSLYLASRAAHSMAYLGFLALRAGVATVNEILGDEGIVHGLAHMMQFHPWKMVAGWSIGPATKKLTGLTWDIANRVPGYRPSK